jgi:type IV pilus assembly protein PilA
MKKELKNNKGFSLVELIVVIAIMAVLVGVLAPQFMKYVESSRQSTDIDNVQSMKTAIETESTELLATGTETITISGGKATSSMTLTTMDTSIDLKSGGWGGTGVYTYDQTTGKWAVTTSDGTNAGGSGTRSLDDIFK